jgi:aspartyl-tRNA synthetase
VKDGNLMRTLAVETSSKINQQVTVKGWVQSRRDHGGLIFIDLRDHSGLVQLVFHPDKQEAFKLAEKLKDEYVISINGEVKERDKDLINPKLKSGTIEIVVNELTIINTSEVLPFQLFNQETLANEELRFKYRFLDLRRPELQQMLKKRAEYYRLIREYMVTNDFTEIATPILANSSPEGARDFLVPSRVHQGKFYALPQAPQQFKQLLMVAGFNKYYQIATCFRDEDPRADRLYGDFYQLDLEVSFVEKGEEIRSTMDPLIRKLIIDFGGKKILNDKIERFQYQEIIEKYGSDKPDLRFDLPLVDLTKDLSNSEFSVFKSEVLSGGIIKAIKVPGGAKFSRNEIETFTSIATSEGAKGLAYISYSNNELKSPIIKFLNNEEIEAIKNKTNLQEGDIVFFGADKKQIVHKVLSKLRDHFGELLGLKDPNVVATYWIVDFPFYEWDEKNNKLDFGHNPFSMPIGGLESLDQEDKLAVKADQYDLVMNGYEVCSGAVRNYKPEVMYKVFEVLGYDKEYVNNKFGAMINAFKFGAPPHAGCAFGLDRMFMVLTNEDNIREILAFPKNGSGIDLMMNSPTIVDPDQLKEIGIRINN